MKRKIDARFVVNKTIIFTLLAVFICKINSETRIESVDLLKKYGPDGTEDLPAHSHPTTGTFTG